MSRDDDLSAELCARAARWVVDEGLDYPAAKRRAQRELGPGASRLPLPPNEDLEHAVREHIQLFHADTQPVELHALRRLALAWMHKVAEFRPHLGGAVWRGTATRRSDVRIDLYCDDPKSAEIALLNLGTPFDTQPAPADAETVLTVQARCYELSEYVSVHFIVHDLDAQRGALKPDAQGLSWRGDTRAVQRLLEAAGPTPSQAPVGAEQDP